MAAEHIKIRLEQYNLIKSELPKFQHILKFIENKKTPHINGEQVAIPVRFKHRTGKLIEPLLERVQKGILSSREESRVVSRTVGHTKISKLIEAFNSLSNSKNGSNANYKEADTDRLLLMVARVLPTGSNEWEQVGVQYSINRPNNITARDPDSLGITYLSLKGMSNHKKPTGDPTCPPLIRKAKQIQKDINTKVAQLTDDLGMRSSTNYLDIEELESQLSSNNSAPQSDNLLPVYDLTLSTPNKTQEAKL
ncbi:hypothetical protein HDV02_004780 [Globomyces sp. JEL0801]|nr:hypothetical protein HDV02_004780 [Globomyces sp. JEL0801]